MLQTFKGAAELFLWITIFFGCLPTKGADGCWYSVVTSILDSFRIIPSHLCILAAYFSCLVFRLFFGVYFACIVFGGLSLQVLFSTLIFWKGSRLYDSII